MEILSLVGECATWSGSVGSSHQLFQFRAGMFLFWPGFQLNRANGFMEIVYERRKIFSFFHKFINRSYDTIFWWNEFIFIRVHYFNVSFIFSFCENDSIKQVAKFLLLYFISNIVSVFRFPISILHDSQLKRKVYPFQEDTPYTHEHDMVVSKLHNSMIFASALMGWYSELDNSPIVCVSFKFLLCMASWKALKAYNQKEIGTRCYSIIRFEVKYSQKTA